MAPPLIPTSLPAGWQTELQPHEWQEAADLARQIIHEEALKSVVPGAPARNPRLEEAKQTLAMANDALNVYDEAAATGGTERLRAGAVGGIKGIGNLLRNVVMAVPRALAGTYNLATNPEQTVDRWDKGIEATMGQLGEAIQHPIRTAENASPEATSEVAASLASLPLPGAKMSTAIGRTRPLAALVEGPLDAMTARVGAAPTVLETALAPFKRVGGAISSWSRKAEMQNEANRAKALRDVEAAESHRVRRSSIERARERQDELHNVNIESARRRQDILGETLNRQTGVAKQLDDRIQLLEDEITRQPDVAKNLQLRNELLELQLQRAQAAEAASEGGAAIDRVIKEPFSSGGPPREPPPSTPRSRRPPPKPKPTPAPATTKPAAATTSVEAPTGSPAAKPKVTPKGQKPKAPRVEPAPKGPQEPIAPEGAEPKTPPPDENLWEGAETPEAPKTAFDEALERTAAAAQEQAAAKAAKGPTRSVEPPKTKSGNFEFPQFNEDVNIAQKKLWPTETSAAIENYLNDIKKNLEYPREAPAAAPQAPQVVVKVEAPAAPKPKPTKPTVTPAESPAAKAARLKDEAAETARLKAEAEKVRQRRAAKEKGK